MMVGELTRRYTGGLGTLGILTLGELSFYTIEKDWKQNTASISCIPEGEYECRPRWSSKNQPHYDWAYEITNVPNRSDVLIHIANWPSQLEGCIAPGLSWMLARPNELGVSSSGMAIQKLHDYLKREPFVLVISMYDPHAKVYQ